MSVEVASLELTAEWAGKKVRIAAKVGGDVIHLDTLDPASAAQRATFAKAVREKCPAVTPDLLDAELLKIATAPGGTAPPPPADVNEVDIRRVVRPEQFHTPDVSGLTVPVVSADGNALTPRWRTYLRWPDGRRAVTDQPDAIGLPDGGTLYVHPDSGTPPASDPPPWRADARRAWLGGSPAPDPANLFRRLCERIAHFLDFPPDEAPGYAATAALWVVLTYAYTAWDAIPYLYVGGPMGSGKSRLLEVLARLVFRPLVSANLTAAALFRTLHARGGTMIYDEAERLRQSTPDVQDVTGMLLAGYRRGATATRLEPVGDSFRPVQFEVFGPKALGCIAGLPPTLASRCVPFLMFRAGGESPKPRRRLDADPSAWEALRDDLHALALEHGPEWVGLAGREDVVPAGVSGRNYELWQPLLALGWWFESRGAGRLLGLMQEHARATAEGAKDDAVPEADEALLDALAEAVRDGRTPTPGELLQRVQERDLVTFKTWHPTSVSRRLKAYGIAPPKKSNGEKRYRHVTMHMLRRIERHYGIDLGFAEGGPTGTPLNAPG